jgi:hypothetical protein
MFFFNVIPVVAKRNTGISNEAYVSATEGIPALTPE